MWAEIQTTSPRVDDAWKTDPMAANEDVKEQMRKALEAKKNKKSGKRDGVGPSQGKVHEHADREGGKREFRRKSG